MPIWQSFTKCPPKFLTKPLNAIKAGSPPTLCFSSEESGGNVSLEQRTSEALTHPEQVERFGGLSFGESTHLVDEVKSFNGDASRVGATFLLADQGRLTLPVWVDHVGSEGTRYVTGDLLPLPLVAPDPGRLPKIEPPEPQSGIPRKKGP